MIKVNYHTHTSRCGHAIGKDEDYVRNAVQAGIQVLGFSDHAAYHLNRHTERMTLSRVPEYLDSLRALKEKYRDTIDILVGMEVEYYPDQWDTLQYYREEMDYLILGQHSLGITHASSYNCKTPEHLNAYADSLEEACARGLCEYIAHPDVILFRYPRIDEHVYRTAEKIADISLKYDIPLEINCGSGVHRPMMTYDDGIRYPYPSRAFLEVFAERGCKMIIGLDAHDPRDFLTDIYLQKALSIGEGLSLNIIEDFDIREAADRHKKSFY